MAASLTGSKAAPAPRSDGGAPLSPSIGFTVLAISARRRRRAATRAAHAAVTHRTCANAVGRPTLDDVNGDAVDIKDPPAGGWDDSAARVYSRL